MSTGAKYYFLFLLSVSLIYLQFSLLRTWVSFLGLNKHSKRKMTCAGVRARLLLLLIVAVSTGSVATAVGPHDDDRASPFQQPWVRGSCCECYSEYCDDAHNQGKTACDACVSKHKSDLDGPKCQNNEGTCYDKAKDWCEGAHPAPPLPRLLLQLPRLLLQLPHLLHIRPAQHLRRHHRVSLLTMARQRALTTITKPLRQPSTLVPTVGLWLYLAAHTRPTH